MKTIDVLEKKGVIKMDGSDGLIEVLENLIGKDIIVNMLGGGYAPHGILTAVKKDCIELGDTIIPISSIANIKLGKRNFQNGGR